jgi:hypothetical protein
MYSAISGAPDAELRQRQQKQLETANYRARMSALRVLMAKKA